MDAVAYDTYTVDMESEQIFRRRGQQQRVGGADIWWEEIPRHIGSGMVIWSRWPSRKRDYRELG